MFGKRMDYKIERSGKQIAFINNFTSLQLKISNLTKNSLLIFLFLKKNHFKTQRFLCVLRLLYQNAAKK